MRLFPDLDVEPIFVEDRGSKPSLLSRPYQMHSRSESNQRRGPHSVWTWDNVVELIDKAIAQDLSNPKSFRVRNISVDRHDWKSCHEKWKRLDRCFPGLKKELARCRGPPVQKREQKRRIFAEYLASVQNLKEDDHEADSSNEDESDLD